MRTIPQAIALFSGVYFTPYPEQLAISVLACLPLLVIFIFLSNRIHPDENNKRLLEMDVRTEVMQVIYDSLDEK